MIFFDGLLYRLSLKTAVLLRVHLQYYPHHMMPINRIPFLSGTKESVLLAFGCTLYFNRRCLQKFLHRLQSSSIIIFYILKQTQILVFIHIFWKYVILEMFIGDLPIRFSIVFMSSNHRHHLPHTLKQTQNFVFIHILQYVILEVFCRITFR